MSRQAALRAIRSTGIMPVIRTRSADLALRAANALREGGIDVLEVTMTVPDALQVIESLAKRFGSAAWIGAGSVLDPNMAQGCIDAGAKFLVAPGFDAEVVKLAHSADVAVAPGALSATEVLAARAAGADLIKIFPCSLVGGPRYLRALRGPLPDVPFMPSGGIDLDSIPHYFAAGAYAVGVGGELVDEALLTTGDDRKLVERARQFVAAARIARHPKN